MALRFFSGGILCANFLRTFPRPRERSGLCGYQRIRRLNGLTSQACKGQRAHRFAQVACSKISAVKAFSTSSAGMTVWKSPWKSIEIPENENLAHHVMRDFSIYGNDVALVDSSTGRQTTFAQFKDGVVKTASALTKQGYKKGDVAVIFSPNNPEFPVFYLAWISIGGIVSSVNNVYTAAELQRTIGQSSAKVVATVPDVVDVVKIAAKTCPELKEIIVFGEAEGCRPLSNLLEDDGKAFPENVNINPKEDLAALPFSSGTTGLPKGVMLTHYNILANVDLLQTKEVVGLGREDAIIGSLPFFHIYGQVVIMLSALFSGSKTITMSKFDADLYLRSMEQHKVTFLHVVPPMILFLANHPKVDNYDFSSVHTLFTGAAPAGGEIIEKACNRINVHRFRQGFGVTEGSSVTHVNPIEGFKYHTCGIPTHNTAHKIIDLETGHDLGVGEEGEFLIRGPQIMKGYFQNPEATASTLVDGWLHTGDIGYTDEDGHVIITDRLKELIKFKGFQVAPAELENLLVTHPGILDAAVIGKPDERVGELPRAYVVKHPDHNITDEDIHEFLEDKVAPFKKLTGGIEFRDQIPKSAAGKILRRELKAEFLEETK